jgi:hypothetical protein
LSHIDKLIREKKVCLLCCGASLDAHEIDFNEYDICIGTNRIHKTKYFEELDIIFDGCHSIHDPLNEVKVEKFNKSKKLKLIIFMPGKEGIDSLEKNLINYEKQIKKDYEISNKSRNFTKRMFVGTETLCRILKHKPKLIHIFGMDFYQTNYTKELENDYVYGGFFHHSIKKLNEERTFCKRIIHEFNSIYKEKIKVFCCNHSQILLKNYR